MESLGIRLLSAACAAVGIPVAQAHPSGRGWWRSGVLYADPEDRRSVPQTQRYFTNLETAASAVRVLYSDKAGQSYLLKALGKRPQARGLLFPTHPALPVLGWRAGALGQCWAARAGTDL